VGVGSAVKTLGRFVRLAGADTMPDSGGCLSSSDGLAGEERSIFGTAILGSGRAAGFAVRIGGGGGGGGGAAYCGGV
jgi:hypothetical protein